MKRFDHEGPFFRGPFRAHSGVFREVQEMVRMAERRDEDSRLSDRQGRSVDARKRFLMGIVAIGLGALGLEAISSFSKNSQVADLRTEGATQTLKNETIARSEAPKR